MELEQFPTEDSRGGVEYVKIQKLSLNSNYSKAKLENCRVEIVPAAYIKHYSFLLSQSTPGNSFPLPGSIFFRIFVFPSRKENGRKL